MCIVVCELSLRAIVEYLDHFTTRLSRNSYFTNMLYVIPVTFDFGTCAHNVLGLGDTVTFIFTNQA